MITSFKNSDIDFSVFDEHNPYFHMVNTIKSMKSLPGMKVLDIGCGRERKYQNLSFWLAERGCEVTGIDIECKSSKGNPTFIRCAIEDMKLGEKFDAVISEYFFGYASKDWSIHGLGKAVKDYETGVMEKIFSLLVEGGISVHYMNESFSLIKEDLESLGFSVIKYPSFEKLNPLEDGICILRK